MAHLPACNPNRSLSDDTVDFLRKSIPKSSNILVKLITLVILCMIIVIPIIACITCKLLEVGEGIRSLV